MKVRIFSHYVGMQILRFGVFILFVGVGSASASTYISGFDSYNNPILEMSYASTDEVVYSGSISDGGSIVYDTVLGTGAFQFDAVLSDLGAVSLHDVSLTTNADGGIRMQGLFDFTDLGFLNNNVIGDLIVQYDYDDTVDVTTFTYSPIAYGGSPYEGMLLLDGVISGHLLDFELTSTLLAYVENPYPTYSPVPVPPAVWLFGSGLLGLIGFARRMKI